jgi:hypothetical protein
MLMEEFGDVRTSIVPTEPAFSCLQRLGRPGSYGSAGAEPYNSYTSISGSKKYSSFQFPKCHLFTHSGLEIDGERARFS